MPQLVMRSSNRRCFPIVQVGVALFMLAGQAAASPSMFRAQDAAPPQRPTTGRLVAAIALMAGAAPLAGVEIELRALEGNVVLARTATDNAGEASIPDLAAGRYVIVATPPGFAPTESPPIEVRAGETSRLLLHVQLIYVAPAVEVRAQGAPPPRVQPVVPGETLLGSVLEVAPVDGDDFQSLLPLLPGVVRGPDGRLRVKGGLPVQGALQISSASLVDPSSGEFDLELPGASVESVELLANPFAAEFGRFSTSITRIR